MEHRIAGTSWQAIAYSNRESDLFESHEIKTSPRISLRLRIRVAGKTMDPSSTYRYFDTSAARFLALGALLAAFSAPSASGADNGAALVREHCASCHGETLGGGAGPALVGAGFTFRWSGKSAALYDLISTTMPPGQPASLSKPEYRAITQYLLAQSTKEQASIKSAAAGPQVQLPAAPRIVGTASTHGPDDAELARPNDADWLTYNRDYRSQRYSPLREITPQNVASLVPKCIFQIGEVGPFQASPIVRDGRMYVTTAHRTLALDAATCKPIWTHDYVPAGPELRPLNRGVALYQGMVIRGACDGHLFSLDAATGKLLWDVWVADSRKGYWLAAAPVVFDGKVFIGEAGADTGANGHVHAFDAATGRLLWTFDLIPTGQEPGADTWGKSGVAGGGSTWSTITIDPETHSVLFPVGNPAPDLDDQLRPGNNLYTDSVIVLDADTGKLKWYVQQNPHDTHDWDTGAAPTIFDQEGRRFLAVGSKDARLYIYDRDSHALLAKADLAQHLNADIPLSSKPVRVCPGVMGGVEWNGAAYDPNNRMLFINSVDWCATLTRQDAEHPGAYGLGGAYTQDPPQQATGSLRAFDAATGLERWVYTGGPMVAGITTTATGLVFTGSPAGDLLAFDSKTGRQLYSFYTGGALAGGVATYMVAGKQYVVAASGNSSKSVWFELNTGAATIVVFGLP
jgi:alcohol dehydrogenase (cytochrome c)